MAAGDTRSERVPTYCALCVSRCGAIATVEDGRFVRLDPDPSHPTGRALCAKGRAGPELVHHRDRLRHPLKRTRPKGDPDPGWEPIGWDEALALTASRLRALAAESGPESVAFSMVSPSTSASEDSMAWVDRLTRAFGSPNLVSAMELCGWGRHFATVFTFGAPVPGRYLPDLENAGCILFWGYNPNHARLSHATAAIAAQKRGARLVVVDPRRTEPARRADAWLQVRPGTDGALALGLAGVMIEHGWFDEPFVREWTDGPLLVRADTGRRLTAADLSEGGDPGRLVAWSRAAGHPVLFDPARGQYEVEPADLALSGEHVLETPRGPVRCRTAFELASALCRSYTPARVETITGVPGGEVERAARLLWEARPLAYYAWSGVEMQTGSTQIARAIAQLSVLTGSFDALGGNVLFPAVPAPGPGSDRPPLPARTAVALGVQDRPLGPARWGHTTTDELYRGILDRQPYAVRGLVGFGSNLLLSHGDVLRGRAALAALDFYVHADLFMNPTAELADLVLPVASCFEREALKLGFEVSPEAQSLVQLRRPVAAPPGEARSDTRIVFDLAVALGLGAYFWDGDVDAAYRHQLGPSGLSLDWLRDHPEGARVALETRHRKFAERSGGVPRGLDTPTRKIELYSETLLAHGQALPEYRDPLVGPVSRPDLVGRYPLILTCTKHTLFCESQHRALPALRRKAMDPEVELHPTAAAARGIAEGDWVRIETPDGRVRARARLNDTLQPDVVCGQHGWWQACPEVGAPGYDPFGPEGANFNLLISSGAIDPVSGSVPHRAYLCEVRPAEAPGPR